MSRKNGVINDYFNWLCDIVGEKFDGRTYRKLLMELFRREFVWIIDLDDNRAADGENLREIYCDLHGEIGFYAVFSDISVSCLEVLIGIARRMDFLCEKEYVSDDLTSVCFWEMMENLGLARYFDSYLRGNNEFLVEKIDEIIDIWMYRRFDFNGFGGLFPLKWGRLRPGQRKKDQRKVEIWYQMQAYMIEKEVEIEDFWG